MNDELQKQLAQMLANLQGAATWTADQIPPLVHEKIVFGRITETFWIFGFAAICCVSLRLSTRFLARAMAANRGDAVNELGAGVAGVVCGALCVICAVASLIQIQSATMVWFAPRLYIVDWLKGMVTR